MNQDSVQSHTPSPPCGEKERRKEGSSFHQYLLGKKLRFCNNNEFLLIRLPTDWVMVKSIIGIMPCHSQTNSEFYLLGP